MREQDPEKLRSENEALREENKKLQRKINDLELLVEIYRSDFADSVDERKEILVKLIDIAEEITSSIMRDEEDKETKLN